MDAFTIQEKWFWENLNGEAVKHFKELISCHNKIADTMSYENFRTGFQLDLMALTAADLDLDEDGEEKPETAEETEKWPLYFPMICGIISLHLLV